MWSAQTTHTQQQHIILLVLDRAFSLRPPSPSPGFGVKLAEITECILAHTREHRASTHYLLSGIVCTTAGDISSVYASARNEVEHKTYRIVCAHMRCVSVRSRTAATAATAVACD